MGAIALGPNLYAGARAMQDADRSDQERQAFETDQAIRTERLAGEKEARPLRQRAAESAVRHGEQQSVLDDLNIDTAKLRKGELEQATKDATQVRAIHNALTDGARSFQLSGGDPSYLAEAFKKIDPEKMANMKASRAEDGSITFDAGNGQPMTFRGKTKGPDGKELTPDEEVVHFLATAADPLKAFQDKYAHAQKLAVEGEKTARAFGVADRRTAGADARAVNKESEVWKNRQLGQIKPTLDSMLKTTGVSGSFISGYSHGDDAELRGLIEEATEAEIMQGTPVRKAGRQAIDDVRATYDKASTLAKGHAAALAKAKIKPTDRAAVEAAAKAGNTDAQQLLKVLSAAKEALGPSVAKYMESQLPAK